jgi:hypothetical protein
LTCYHSSGHAAESTDLMRQRFAGKHSFFVAEWTKCGLGLVDSRSRFFLTIMPTWLHGASGVT